MNETFVHTAVLIAMAAAGVIIGISIGKRAGFLSFRSLAVFTYTIVMPVSGIAHILRDPDSRGRGYFDAVNRLDPGEMANVILVAGCGLVALVVGVLIAFPKTRVRRQTAPLTPDDRKIVPLVAAAILPLSLWGLFKTQAYVSELENASGRVISISGGNSRYAFISYWTVWAISLFVIWFVLQNRKSKPLQTTLVICFGAAACAASVDWTGGRSDAVLAAVPVVLVLLPLVRSGQLNTLVFSALAVIASAWQIIGLTARRATRSADGSSGLVDFVDWEFGRFSMLGWASQYTSQTGHLYGETLVNAALRLFSGFQRLLGLPPSDFGARAAQRIATEELDRASAGVSDYINPSVMAEMYLNFGLLGVVAICLIIGLLSGYCDRRFLASSTAVVQLCWAFIGLNVALNAQFNELTNPLNSILFRGAPLIAIAALSGFMARSIGTSQKGESPSEQRTEKKIGSTV